MVDNIVDPRFVVKVISKSPNPQQTIYGAMHQDYSSDLVIENKDNWPSEEKCGEIIVKRLLAGERGHFGCLEHPAITLNCGYFPHSVIQQARTHRINTSFDVMSFRYTSNQVLEVATGERDVESVFYLRPVGYYSDRKGVKYFYSEEQRTNDLLWCVESAKRYYTDITTYGMSEEHARGKLPFDYRQHFVVSFNARSLMHFLDLRSKRDAQLEIQLLCQLMWQHFQEWMPEVAMWYEKNRLGKARLAP